MISTHLALQMAHKFEQLGIEDLPVEDVYPAILEQYSGEILTVAGIYEDLKKHPDVPRGAPPISGTYLFTIRKTILWYFVLKIF